MSKRDFLENALSGIDEKYINEAAEELYKRQGTEIRITGNYTEKPQKHTKLKTFLGIAAAIGIIAGGFAVLDRISDNPILVENPSDSSELRDKVVRYERMVITDNWGNTTEIYRDTWDEYAVLMAELVEKLDNTDLVPTSFVPQHSGIVEKTTISLYYGDECDTIEYYPCYEGGILERNILVKNGVSYEASGDEFVRAMEIISELCETLVPNLPDGEYYLDGDFNSDVYILVSDGKIGLMGYDALEFVKQHCGSGNYNEIYVELGEKEFVISSEAGIGKRPIVTEWDKNAKINANKYGTECYYKHAGSVMHSDSIELFGENFYYPEPEQIKYIEEFSHGFIDFTEMRVVDVLAINDVALPLGDETEAKAYFQHIGGAAGIKRFGKTVLSDYRYVSEKSYCSAMADSEYPGDYAVLRYQNPANGAVMDIAASQHGNKLPKTMLPNGMGLIFSDGVFLDGEQNLSLFRLNDDTVVTVLMGGIIYRDSVESEAEFYAAEWTMDGITYSVSGRYCERDEFIGSVVALIYNVDGIGSISSTETPLPTNFSDYEMDFQIFYDHFRGIWSDENGNTIEIGWEDDIFSYELPLEGFYEDENGAYMAQRIDDSYYCLWFVPAYDKDVMFRYPPLYINGEYMSGGDDRVYNIDGETRTVYTKTGEGKFSKHSGMFGYLGLQELCSTTGLDFDLLHNLSFTDYNGATWERSFNAGWLTCQTGVIQYSGKGDEPTVLALEFIKRGTEERKHFACTFKKDESGEYKLADFPNEPFEFDITELDYENSDTLNVKELQEDVRQRRNEGITGYYMVADFHIYRITEDSYYLIRTMGTNQGQWHHKMDIFYYNGEETILVNGYNRCTLYMGGYHIAINNDGYVVILGGDDTVHCIKDGEFLTGYHIGYIGEHFQIEYMNFTDSILTVAYKNYGTGQELKYSIDYSLPKSPIYAGVEVSEGTEGTKINGFTFAQEIGEKLNAYDYLDSDGFKHLNDEVYLIEAKDAEKIMLKPYQSLVLTADKENGFYYRPEDDAYFGIDVNHLAAFEFGYIKDNVIYELNGGYPIEGFIEREMTSYPEGEYRFYINNYTNEIIYFDSVGVAILRTPDIDDYSFVEDIGEKIEKPNYDIIEVVGKPMLSDNMYLVKASDAKFFALKHGDTMVYTLDNGEGYKRSMVSDDNIEPKLIFQTKNTCFVSIGAICDDKIYTIYNGELEEGDTEFNIYDYLPDDDTEYRFFITNLSQDIHYCTSMWPTVY